MTEKDEPMAIRKETVNGGRKIVLREVGTGELAGSVALDGVAGIAAPPVLPPRPEADADLDGLPALDEIYARFQETTAPEEDVLALIPPVDPDAKYGVPRTDTVRLAHFTSMFAGAGLDAAEHEASFEILARGVPKWDPAPEAPTEEQWREFLALTRARITDPENGMTDEQRTAALVLWQRAADGPRPDGVEFALASAAHSRMWRVRYALDDQALQIASWMDVPRDEVKAKVAEFRAEYYDKVARGEEIDIPAQYKSAWNKQAKIAPKDEATVYSYWKAENPELYLNPTPPKRFVALDLETTGLSTKDHHIIEVGCVEYDATGTEIRRWNRLVRPPVGPDGTLSTGDPEVMAVHKITVDDVKDAPTFDEIMPELHELLAGATIIGHNLGFDTKHLKSAFRTYAGENPDAAKHTWDGEIDTLFQAARHMDGLENNKLVTVSGALGIAYTNGHRAEHDAAVAGEVFFELRKGVKARQQAAIDAARARGDLPAA